LFSSDPARLCIRHELDPVIQNETRCWLEITCPPPGACELSPRSAQGVATPRFTLLPLRDAALWRLAGTHRFSRRTRHFRIAGLLVRRRPFTVRHPDFDCASGRPKWFSNCPIFLFDLLPNHQHPVSQTSGIIGRGLRAMCVHVERVPATTRDNIEKARWSKIRPRGSHVSGSSCAMVSALVSDVQELRFR